jgi:hypothetical protein
LLDLLVVRLVLGLAVAEAFNFVEECLDLLHPPFVDKVDNDLVALLLDIAEDILSLIDTVCKGTVALVQALCAVGVEVFKFNRVAEVKYAEEYVGDSEEGGEGWRAGRGRMGE